MTGRPAAALLLVLASLACSPPAPAPPPPPAAPAPHGSEPASPPGTEGLRSAPCSAHLDLARGSPEQRSFGAAAHSLTGRATLSFHARAPLQRWSWSSSRPAALRIEEGPGDAVTLIAGEPGATLVRMIAESEEASLLVSVPLFVRVQADDTLAAVLDGDLGLAGRERALMSEAKRALEAIYARVNVRFAFRFGLGEEVPDTLPPGGIVEATLHGDPKRCIHPLSDKVLADSGGYAEGDVGRRLVRAPVHACPGIFARHPDTMAAMVKQRARLLADERSAAIYVAAVGRAIGELVAHEVGHQLVGCDTHGEKLRLRCHDRGRSSLLNKGGERSFSDRTGIVIKATQYSSTWRDDFPAPGTYEDLGVSAINTLAPDEQEVLDRILPATLPEEAACP